MRDIKHPEWLKVSKPQDSIDLFNRGLLPDSIARWMLVTGLRHPLRAIYGSNFRAAMALLWLALTDKPRMWWICRRHFSPAMTEAQDQGGEGERWTMS